MRNHLAEQVLDENKLFFLKQYRDRVYADNPEELDQYNELLEYTSKVIKAQHNPAPVTRVKDSRLKDLRNF